MLLYMGDQGVSLFFWIEEQGSTRYPLSFLFNNSFFFLNFLFHLIFCFQLDNCGATAAIKAAYNGHKSVLSLSFSLFSFSHSYFNRFIK